MRLAATQNLEDHELFYIIENSFRLTGMPACGTGKKAAEEERWRLVHVIRHLPRITPEEIEQMEGLNPKSPAKIRQQIEEEKFLGGAPDESSTSTSTHRYADGTSSEWTGPAGSRGPAPVTKLLPAEP